MASELILMELIQGCPNRTALLSLYWKLFHIPYVFHERIGQDRKERGQEGE